MRPAIVMGCSLGLAAILVTAGAGGGAGAKFEDVLKETLGLMDKLSSSLSTIKDEESASTVRPELRKIAGQWHDLRKKTDSMKLPEKEEKDRLEKAYREKLVQAHKKLFAEIARVRKVQGGKEALAEIRAFLAKDGK